ncbi:mucin-binding protein [Lactobacillus amylovorus]|uniref:mucin-binding protein n=1 Tax=Lactobacillus amylovorus TaxID=1604 RepID=UPI003F8AA63B
MFNKEQLQRFSIRKLTVGAASVLIGVLFLTSWNTNTVYADSINGESIAKNNNPQEGNPAVNKDNVQIVDNDSTEVSNISDSKSSKVIKSDATKSDIVRDKTTIDDNSRTKVPEHTAPANNKQALTTVTEDNGAKVSKTEKYSNSDIKKQPKNSEETQETTLVKKVLDKEKLSSESLIEENLSSESLIEENLSSESLINPKKSDGKVEIRATDPSNTIPASDPITYPEKLNGLINKDGKDKYIYQVLSLDGGSKLILSVNRNDHTDKRIYAYVTDGNYKKVKQSKTIGMDQPSIITINGREYQLNNNGSSEVSIKNGKKVSTQNSSTVTAQLFDSDFDYAPYYIHYPIGQDYGLGNTSDSKCSAIGEIVPVFTKNSVIKYYYRDNEGHLQEFKNVTKYYYRDNEGHLQEFKNSELPNVSVEGFTGQKFEIDNVAKYKRVVIPGYHLISDNIPKNLPKGNFNGTLSQFSDGKYYKKVYYNFDTNTVEYSVLYHQVSPDGTMEVCLLDDNDQPLTKSIKIAPNTSTPFKLYTGYGEHTTVHNITVRNPYVTAAPHEVQLIYAKNGKIIPVDKNHNPIKGADQPVFPTDLNNPRMVESVEIPDLSAMGYHPLDKAVKTVDPDSKDPSKDIEVEYVKSGTISVKYHDNTEDKDIDGYGKNASGDEDDPFNYDPATDLATLKGKGYVLDGDLPKIPDKLPDENKTVIIPLKHGTKKVNREHSASFTVHYIYKDGGQAKPEHEQTLSFTENGIQDLVTQKITWTPADSQKFDDVATPVITGYTPDQDKVIGQTANFETDNREVTVTYHANAQTAKITYIDDTTKNNLDSKDANGKFGQTITFTTAPSDEIASYEKQGYVLVSNSFDNNKYQADDNNNVFYVHLKHGTKKVSRNDDVNMTVHYVMDDNSEAPSDNKQSLSFTENGIQDLVTKNIAWTPVDSQTFKDVVTPKMTGYTPDQDSVTGQTVNFGDNDINVTVHYSANTQTATITYIDDTTKNTLDSKDANGKFGQAIAFATAPSDEIANYKKQGYVLVSNSFNNQTYAADNNNNVFYVHLKHKTESVTRNDAVTRTIHYLYDNGNTAQPDKTQTVSFNETGTKDDVTNKTTWSNDNAQTVDSVITPSIIGYTPDKSSIEKQSFKFGDQDVEVTVTYHANAQTAKITYIDDTTKNNLDSKDASGKFGQAITFTTSPSDEIASYEKQGYVLVSNSFDNNKYQADDNNNVFYVHLKHDTKKVSRNDDVNMTVHYVMDDNSEAPSDNKQSLSFTEDGIQDLVTQKITWTPAESQTLKDVDSPVLTGYTADIKTVNGKAVNFGDNDINVTVHYSANAQTATITYIDDTTKNNLDSKDANGKFGQAITFATAPSDEIASYEKQGYVLVSNSFDNNKYQADDNNNVFYVHLKHDTKKVSRNDDVNMTVHYVMDNNSEAPSDNKQSLSFTEDGIQDLVTQKITWTPAESQTLKDVDSPVLTGYTADIKTVNGKAVNFGDNDINVTVHYSANAQTATITYIDDTTKNNLDSKDANGKFGQAITFATAPSDEIANYKKQGYKLVSNDFNDNKYQADNNKNVFYVHLVHDTKTVNREHSASFTVHYIYKDGGQAKPDHEQTLRFTENGSQDLVTQKITWTPADSQKFDDVATPVITGYTPDHDKVIGQTANFETDNREVTVTYLPNVQLGHINYIDDNTGKTLTRDDFSGRTNEHEDYTPIDRIQEFENKGYVFVSSDYPDGGFNFDDNDQQEQVFNVHLKHGIVTVTTKKPQTPNMPIDPDPHSPKYPKDISNTNSDVKRTIDYKFKDGKTAQPTVNDSLHFERTVVIDKVTGDVLSDTWTPSQDFNDVQTPVIQGYTPDRTVVSDTNIGHDHQNIVEHVIYSPDAQHMTITYVDDTTHETLKQDKLDGTSDKDTKYTTNNSINHYTDLHYKLVSDSTNGQDLIFDHDDKADQTYEVHFVHGTHTINQTTSPKQTVQYVYADGLARQGKAADDNVQQLSFTRDGYNDEVTGIDHWNAWTPANSQYKAVNSPVVQGYTPDKSAVEESTVNPTDKDTEITVVYNADKQAAHVIYVDKTTNTTLTSDDLSGQSDKDSGYNTKDTIGKYQSQHYVLTGDETDGKNVIFDHDDKQNQTYYVYFVHGTQKVNRQDTVTSTIDYKFEDGKTAQPTVTQTKHFSEDGVKDLVTGKIVWDEAESQKFDDIATKSIAGYTPDKDNVTGSTVNFGDSDIEVTVTYHNNAQKAVITYVDDVTKKTLASDSQDGKFDHEITFEHDPAEVINSLKEKGYKLVSNDFKDGTKYKADDKQNEFIVHLTHDKQKVNRQDQVIETIHYVYENGSKSQPDHEQTISFTEDGIKDKVTGQIAWTPADSQKFDDIATPVITGYTPDKNSVAGSTVKFGDSDIEVTVTYHNNAQTAKITYIDDTAKKTLASDSQDGKFDHEIAFSHKPSDVISGFEKAGYKLVSNNFKDGTKYKADDKQNEFIVHLTHDKQKVNRQDQVIETIHYVYENGSKSQPDHEQTISFTEDGIKDKVTGQIAWTSATPQKFDDVATPAISGYTPDKGNVTGSTVKFGDKDIEVTVTYHNNAQTAKITYVDDVTKKTLASDSQDGKFDHEITFEHDPAEVIKGLEEKGYKLVSDNFKPGIKYQNDNKLNIFEVHLVHTYEPVETSQTITETVHYIDANGKPVAPDHVAKVVIKVTGTRDKVTDSIIWNTPSTGHFDEVISPEVPNMTPDKKLIPGRDVQYGDSDITESVVYTLDNSTSKTPEKPDKPSKEVSKTPEKPDKPSKEVSKIPEKPNKSSKEVSKIPEKPNKSSKEVSKAPEKSIDSRTVDNHVSAKSTAKRELPQTGATTNTGIWTGLVSMIASLGLLGASKKRKKN